MTQVGLLVVIVAVLVGMLLVAAANSAGRRGAASVARGLRTLEAEGGMAGKTEQDFVRAMGGNPVSISDMPFGQRLLQWTSGTTQIQRIAVMFDAEHRFVKIASRYQV